ncbi:MAG: NUDIX hydrolase [Bacteroidota bacterium]
MVQKYFVFTENKCLVFSSYQQDSGKEGWKKKELNSEKFWEFIHLQPHDEILMPFSLAYFCKAFKKVTAAGGLVFYENHLLMIYRNEKWDLPKGWMESGEFPMQTALREVREECGQIELTIRANPPINTFHLYKMKGKFILKETHWFEMSASSNHRLYPQHNEGISKVEFVPFEKVSGKLDNSYPLIRWIWESYKGQNQLNG